MLNINDLQISSLKQSDREEVKRVLAISITDNFEKNNINDQTYLAEEIKFQTNLIDDYFLKKTTCKLTLVSKINDKVVGLIAYGDQPEKIKKYLPLKYQKIQEIKNLYLLPDYQKKGIGKKLFEEIIKSMSSSGYDKFMLYSSFETGKRYWTYILGKEFKAIKEGDYTKKIWVGSTNNKSI